jgi:hypothetical protein
MLDFTTASLLDALRGSSVTTEISIAAFIKKRNSLS